MLTLVDCIRAKIKNQTFIVVDINVWRIDTDHNVADLKFTDGNDNKVHDDMHVNMTDLPAGQYSLWIANYPGENPGNKVIYLNTEH